jgi:hypothetical protein
MAAKKSAPKKAEKAETTEKKAAPAKAAPKAAKPAAKKAAAEPVAAKTKPVAAAAAPKAPKAPAAKKPVIKLTDKQKETLKKINDSGETGYAAAKAELRSIESLREKKLVKRVKVDKETGSATYLTTVAGKKHASAPDKA